jgi:hypothetical protein
VSCRSKVDGLRKAVVHHHSLCLDNRHLGSLRIDIAEETSIPRRGRVDDEGSETIELAPCCVREILSLRHKAVIRETSVEVGLKT